MNTAVIITAIILFMLVIVVVYNKVEFYYNTANDEKINKKLNDKLRSNLNGLDYYPDRLLLHSNLNGTNLNGTNLNGTNLNGMGYNPYEIQTDQRNTMVHVFGGDSGYLK